MNYTNFNSCWERRANCMEQRLGALDGKRFNFAPVPAPEVAAEGPATALRPHEVRSLVAAGVIRFPDATRPEPPPVIVEPARDRVHRPGHSPLAVVRKLAETGRTFSVDDLKGFDRLTAHSTLGWARRRGLIVVVKRGLAGNHGYPALYRGVKGGRP